MEEKAIAASSKGRVGAQESGEGEETPRTKARTVEKCVEGRVSGCVFEQITTSKGAPTKGSSSQEGPSRAFAS